jgi:tRNA threonylcarbamoyladenosine biosynthesis protein TsaE
MNEPIVTGSEKELASVGSSLAKYLNFGDIVFLEGELGVGKTTISRGILRGFGYEGVVVSPTYTLLELYELASHRVAHLDLYRITTAKDLEGIGFRDYLDGQTICLIEWPENGVGILPAPTLRIILEYAESGRIVRFLTSVGCLTSPLNI